jgi:hypothetical protein
MAKSKPIVNLIPVDMFNGDRQQKQHLSQQLSQLSHQSAALSQQLFCMQNAFSQGTCLSQPTNNELSFQGTGK